MATVDASGIKNGIKSGASRGYNEGWIGKGGDYYSYDINNSRLYLFGYMYVDGIYRTFGEYYYGNLYKFDINNINSLSSVEITSYKAEVSDGSVLEISNFKLDGWTAYFAIVGSLSTDDLEKSFLNGSDIMIGSNSRDYLYSKAGNDHIEGHGGSDRIYGESGHDYLDGGSGDDRIYGGIGDQDQLKGGAGDDYLSGGSGVSDTAIFTGGSTNYEITKSGSNYTIKDLRNGSPDGTDTFNSIEILRFTDRSFTPEEFITYTTPISNDKNLTGTAANDSLVANSDDSYGNDVLSGGAGNDTLKGFRGKDSLDGGSGDDLLKAGNGRDTLTGGLGSDSLFGGFGLNTFTDCDDGDQDLLYLKSDQLASNWIYGKAGNSPNGEKADIIGELDSNDAIVFQGAPGWEGWYATQNVTHTTPFGQTVSGIGIYFYETETSSTGYLEGIYTGSNLNATQLGSIFYLDS